MRYHTNTPDQTQVIAAQIAANHFKDRGGIIALFGELGAGKTTFAQGFAKALGIRDKITSPTFIITRQYPIPGTERTLYHIDLYRLDNVSQLDGLGLQEIFDNPDNLILIEWPERLSPTTPTKMSQLRLEKITDNSRLIHFQP